MSGRKIKQEVLDILASSDLDLVSRRLCQYAEKDLVGPLFSALSRPEETIRWHAITVFGQVLPRLADHEMEAARIVMRRFLWSLNDESGGICWGAPEAMAEVMLHHDRLAAEYLHMLISYLQPDGPLEHQDGNFLELPSLQRGLLWGIGRLAEKRAEFLIARGVPADLLSYLQSEDGCVRGLAVRALGRLRAAGVREAIVALAEDKSPVLFYENGVVRTIAVAELVADALARVE